MKFELVECASGHIHYRFYRQLGDIWYVRLTHTDACMHNTCMVTQDCNAPSTWGVNVDAFVSEIMYG